MDDHAQTGTTTPGPPIRVFLVDDQQLLRSGFSMVINSQPDMRVVGEASNGQEAVRLLGTAEADVVLMDIRMPVMNGIDATSLLTRENPRGVSGDLKVVVLTTFDEDDYALSAIQAGANGFLLKDAPPEELLDAVRTVHRGDAVIAPSTTKRLLNHMAPLISQTREEEGNYAQEVLSPREYEVFTRVAQGKSNSEIALEFFLSEATIKTHVGHILSKLGVRDRVQAAVLAYEMGAVKPGDARDL